jgi:hypothetical protein
MLRLRPLLFAAFTLAGSASAQSPLPSQQTSGQISGHIFRSDTGMPVEGGIVFLRSAANSAGTKVATVHSDKDGSYIFSDVAAGNYVLMAYRSGFVGPVAYGSGSTFVERDPNVFAPVCPRNNPDYSCVSVTRGKRVGRIDMRLIANPVVDTLPIEPISAATFPDHKVSFSHELHISPDGQIVAVVTNDSITSPNCPCEVWLYDMRSHRSVLAVTMLPESFDSIPEWRNYNRSATPNPVIVANEPALDVLLTWTPDNTLYVEAGNQGPFNTGENADTKIAATLAGAKEIEQFPPEVTAALKLQVSEHTVRDGEGRVVPCTFFVGRTDQFVVTVVYPPPSCKYETQLIVARSDGSNRAQPHKSSIKMSL